MNIALREKSTDLAKARALVDRDLAIRSSCPDDGTRLSAQSCQKLRPGDLTPQDAQRAWVADLIWRAFPADSMTACSQIAASEMTRLGVNTSERQVRNLLRCEHDASFQRVNLLLALTDPTRIWDVMPKDRAS